MASEAGYRDKCLSRGGTDCPRCAGAKLNGSRLLVHHIDGDRSNDSDENLTRLCSSCHQLWHKNEDQFEDFDAFLSSFPTYRIDGSSLGDGRALLTEREREIISEEVDVSDNYRYKVQSIVRNRVRKHLSEDMDTLEEHFPEVFEMVREEVCNKRRWLIG